MVYTYTRAKISILYICPRFHNPNGGINFIVPLNLFTSLSMHTYETPELSFYWLGYIPRNYDLLERLMNIPNSICHFVDVPEEGNEHIEIWMEFAYPAPRPTLIGQWETADCIN